MNDNRKLPPVETRFKQGQSGNPGGKAKGTRIRLNAAFLNALADDFDRFGKGAIERARREDAMGYVKCVASLMPKQVEQSHPLEDLTDAELTAGIALLRTRLSGLAEEGGEPPPRPSQVN